MKRSLKKIAGFPGGYRRIKSVTSIVACVLTHTTPSSVGLWVSLVVFAREYVCSRNDHSAQKRWSDCANEGLRSQVSGGEILSFSCQEVRNLCSFTPTWRGMDDSSNPSDSPCFVFLLLVLMPGGYQIPFPSMLPPHSLHTNSRSPEVSQTPVRADPRDTDPRRCVLHTTPHHTTLYTTRQGHGPHSCHIFVFAVFVSPSPSHPRRSKSDQGSLCACSSPVSLATSRTYAFIARRVQHFFFPR